MIVLIPVTAVETPITVAVIQCGIMCAPPLAVWFQMLAGSGFGNAPHKWAPKPEQLTPKVLPIIVA